MDAFKDLRNIVLLSDHPDVPDQNITIESVFEIDRSHYFLKLPDGTEFDATDRAVTLSTGEDVTINELTRRWSDIYRAQRKVNVTRKRPTRNALTGRIIGAVGAILNLSWARVAGILAVICIIAFVSGLSG